MREGCFGSGGSVVEWGFTNSNVFSTDISKYNWYMLGGAIWCPTFCSVPLLPMDQPAADGPVELRQHVATYPGKQHVAISPGRQHVAINPG